MNYIFYGGKTQITSTLEDGSIRQTLIILGTNKTSMIFQSEKFFNGQRIEKNIEIMRQATLTNGEQVVIRRSTNKFDESTYSLSYVPDAETRPAYYGDTSATFEDEENPDFDGDFFDEAITLEIDKKLCIEYLRGVISADQLLKAAQEKATTIKSL